MGHYRFLEHTADALVECHGESFRDLLETSAQALYSIACETVEDRHTATHHVRVSGETYEEILIRWLQDLIFFLDTRCFIGVVFDIPTLERGPDGFVVDAHVHGYSCEPDEREAEVKAATYHDMRVAKEEGGIVARIVFDL
ncbi:MAG: archease [bacterium]|nr:archease [bacterium]